MNETIIDFPKITQMLDSGWRVIISKNEMGSYLVLAKHANEIRMQETRRLLCQSMAENKEFIRKSGMSPEEAVELMDFDDDGFLITDDFTPEQSLTRMAYKVFGQIL